MPEIELGHGEEGGHDASGQKVGVMAACIGVLLAVVTIFSHRAHTAAMIAKTEANDQWSFYQAKKMRSHTNELGLDMLNALAGEKNKAAEEAKARYKKEKERYAGESEEIKKEAEGKGSEGKHAERQALRYDLGEGLIEIGLVLCSLYFISKKKLFPTLAVIAALAGAAIFAWGRFFV